MMARAQIALPREEHRRARERAAALGISLAEYVRRLVTRDLARLGPKADPAEVFDLGKSVGSDIAAAKDDYVGQAVAASGRKRRTQTSVRREKRRPR